MKKLTKGELGGLCSKIIENNLNDLYDLEMLLRVHIQIVTVGASKMGDIFSLPATDTMRAFFFHCIIHIC